MRNTIRYGDDFRLEVIVYVCHDGNKAADAVSLYGVSKATVSRWCKEYREQGKTHPSPPKPRVSKVSYEDLSTYLSSNPHSDLSAMSNHFGMSVSGIHSALQRNGFVYKKSLYIPRS